MAQSDQTALSPEEQKFFDTQGEDAGGATAGADTSVTGTPEAEAGSEPSPKTGTTEQQTQEPVDKQNRSMVPLAAVQEERARRQEREVELKTEREARRLLEQRTDAVLQAYMRQQQQGGAQQPGLQQPDAPAIPDLDKDPVGFIVGKITQQDRELARLNAVEQQRLQQGQQQGAVSQIQNTAGQLESQFASATTDYWDASKFLRDSRVAEYRAMGRPNPEASVNAEAFEIATLALQQGKNPAEVVYGLAQQRGYKKPAPAQQTEQGVETPAAQIARLEAGQQAGASLSGARGTAPKTLTAQRLIEMPEAEFAKMLATPEGKALLGA